LSIEGDTDAAAGNQRDWGLRGTAGVSFAAALTFDNVSVSIGSRKVLDGLSLELAPSEIVCLLGESGSGKSTLLRVAAGLQEIDGGEVRINNQVVTSPDVMMPPEKRGVGLMFQDFALFPHLNVLENVAFGLSRLGRKVALQQSRMALRRVGLDDRETSYPHQLSGGQQQRLALARTIAPRPGILMLDEPFSGLDARMRESVRGETLAVLRETHATSLIVTHDPEEAMLLGDRVAFLRDGRIAQVDTAAALYERPVDLSAARFLSSLGELRGVVMGGKVETPLGPVPAKGMADGQKVMIGLRPVGAVGLSLKSGTTPGRIISKRNALGVDTLEVQVEGFDRLLRIRRAADAKVGPGQDVYVSLSIDHVLVFAED